MNSNPKLSYAIAAILSGSPAGFVLRGGGRRHRYQYRTHSGNHRHGAAAHGEHAGRADHDPGPDRGNAGAIERAHLRRFHQVPAQCDGREQRSGSRRHLHARSVRPRLWRLRARAASAAFRTSPIYLDDQSGQLPGRNLDVYAADIERIEVLEGPQGTLFGAGAEAGVLRYITNKPKLDVTEGNVNAGYAYTSARRSEQQCRGVINLPLIADTLAVRAVIYSDTTGGYINNVPGDVHAPEYRPRDCTTRDYPAVNGHCPNGLPPGGPGYCVPPGSPSINNDRPGRQCDQSGHLPGNPRRGAVQVQRRLEVLLSQSYQDMDSQGVFYE